VGGWNGSVSTCRTFAHRAIPLAARGETAASVVFAAGIFSCNVHAFFDRSGDGGDLRLAAARLGRRFWRGRCAASCGGWHGGGTRSRQIRRLGRPFGFVRRARRGLVGRGPRPSKLGCLCGALRRRRRFFGHRTTWRGRGLRGRRAWANELGRLCGAFGRDVRFVSGLTALAGGDGLLGGGGRRLGDSDRRSRFLFHRQLHSAHSWLGFLAHRFPAREVRRSRSPKLSSMDGEPQAIRSAFGHARAIRSGCNSRGTQKLIFSDVVSRKSVGRTLVGGRVS
jgi:hypothetical protein